MTKIKKIFHSFCNYCKPCYVKIKGGGKGQKLQFQLLAILIFTVRHTCASKLTGKRKKVLPIELVFDYPLVFDHRSFQY